MITLTFAGQVILSSDGMQRLLLENQTYPGQQWSGEDMDLLFKMFPDAKMRVTVDIEPNTGVKR